VDSGAITGSMSRTPRAVAILRTVRCSEAQYFWEEVDNVDVDGPSSNAEQFMHVFMETEAMQALYAGDPCVVEICSEYHPMCLAF